MPKEILGSTGALFAGACCLGFAPALALFTSLGAGFLINDLVLLPLFAGMLGFTLWTLHRSRACHGHSGPLILGAVSAVVAFAALWISTPVSYAAMAAFFAASIWNLVLSRRIKAEGDTNTTAGLH